MEERFYPVEDFCNDKVPKEENKQIVDRIKKIVESRYTSLSKISVMGVGRTKGKHGYEGSQVYLAGGLNGTGIWSDYLKDLSAIMEELENNFASEVENIVLANMEFDLLDDIFYPVIDIVYSYDEDDGEEEEEEKEEEEK